MKSNKKIKSGFYFQTTVLALLLSACSLDIEETDSLITKGPSDVFNGVENPAAAIDGMYGTLSGQFGSQEELFAISEVTTDILVVPTRGTDWGDNGVWRTLHAHTWGPTHRDVVNVWNNK